MPLRGFHDLRPAGTGDSIRVLYLDYKETVMNEIILGIGVAAFLVYAVFNIIYLMRMMKTGDSVSAFLK